MSSDAILPDGERLQKVMARSGVASRRASEDLIVAGRVRVNGEVVTTLGTRVDPDADAIEVDGLLLQTDPEKVYLALNKPAGIVSTLHDEQGRPDLSQFTETLEHRVYNVGRLDAATRGLLLLTNDGEFAHGLAHPSFGISKVYLAKVRGTLSHQALVALRAGVDLEDGVTAVDAVRVQDSSGGSSLVEVTLHSGKNRIVRRLLAAVGTPVEDLLRKQIGSVHLGSLPPGQMRPLNRAEVASLRTALADHNR